MITVCLCVLDCPPPPPLALGDLHPQEECDHGNAAHHAQPCGAVHHRRAAEVVMVAAVSRGHQPRTAQLEAPRPGHAHVPVLEELERLWAEGGADCHPGHRGQLGEEAASSVKYQ